VITNRVRGRHMYVCNQSSGGILAWHGLEVYRSAESGNV
jgi:hypothetical protein